MKCQRGFFDIEDDVCAGVPFDERKMEEMGGIAYEEDGGEYVVTCVLSKGWVKRPYRGSSEELGRICKARVLVKRVAP
jgi:hypothetical protein